MEMTMSEDGILMGYSAPGRYHILVYTGQRMIISAGLALGRDGYTKFDQKSARVWPLIEMDPPV